MLGNYNEWNIIWFTNKTTTSEYFGYIHKSFLDDIIDNMKPLVQYGKYGAINEADTIIIGYYFVNYVSNDFTLK